MLSVHRSSHFGRAVNLIAAAFGLLALAVQAAAPICLLGFPAPHSGSGNSIIICTAHGFQSVSLDGTANPATGTHDKDGSGAQCPMCGAFRGGPLLAPYAALLIAVLFLWHSAGTFVPTAPHAPRRAHRSFLTRAPPAAA